MLIPVKPEFLDEYLGIGLANYSLNIVSLVELGVTVGGFFPLRTKAGAPLYCKERRTAETVISRLDLRKFVIRDEPCLIYLFDDDPHGFCLNRISSTLHLPRVRIFPHEEVVQMLDAGRQSFRYPRSEFDRTERPKRRKSKKKKIVRLAVTHYECSECGCRDLIERFVQSDKSYICPNCHEDENVFPFRMYKCDECGSEWSQLDCFEHMPADMDPLIDDWPFKCEEGCDSTTFHQIPVTEMLPGNLAKAHS